MRKKEKGKRLNFRSIKKLCKNAKILQIPIRNKLLKPMIKLSKEDLKDTLTEFPKLRKSLRDLPPKQSCNKMMTRSQLRDKKFKKRSRLEVRWQTANSFKLQTSKRNGKTYCKSKVLLLSK